MVNDLDYIKLSFSELPHFTTSDSWINYKFNEADTSWMIFALEEREGKEPKWRRIHSSYWGSNHCTLCYGHIGAQLMTLASMLRIPVCMHNVPEDKIFRPAAWNAFGMDKEGQDYRACKNYGPLYK